MNKINLVNQVLDGYLRQNISALMLKIQTQINAAADGYLFPVSTVTSDYTMSLNDALIIADSTSAPLTVTLKPSAECKCKFVIIKKTDASANAVTISSAETIDGAATDSLANQYDTIRLMSDGAQWLKV